MKHNHALACALAACALSWIGCARPVVPEHVRARVAYRELNPSGTWVRADGSGATLTFTPPVANHQLFGVAYAEGNFSLQGEALVDGTSVYATRHTGVNANDLCIYLYDRRAGGGVEALWGSARGIAPIAYEQGSPTRTPEGWDGVYAEWGNNMGGRYQDRLIIGRSLDGAEGVHRLHWTQPSGGWYRGMAFELGERLVGVRLPGVLVRQTSYDVGAYRVTTRHSEVGRDVLWYVGAYRLEGDALAGVELSNSNEGASCGASGQRCLVPVRWVRAGTPIEAPAPPPVEAPPVEAPPVEPPAEEEPPAAGSEPAPSETPSEPATEPL